MKLIVKLKTKSNYRRLNGYEVEVVEIKGSRVTCSLPDFPNDKNINADFDIKEVEFISYQKPNLLKFMHDTVGPVNRIKSMATMIDQGRNVSDHVKMIGLIIKSADDLNKELDTFYSQYK